MEKEWKIVNKSKARPKEQVMQFSDEQVIASLFYQTKMIHLPKQFICIYHINLKAISYHQGQPKPQLKQAQLTLLQFDLTKKVIFSLSLLSKFSWA